MNPAPLQLHDIHLPQPVSWWPPAPGWWLVAVLLLVLVLGGLWWRHRHRCRTYRRVALSRLADLENRYHQAPQDVALITELSRLLRHMAVLHYPSRDCAGLQGEAWLKFLDQPFGDAPFSSGIGQALAQGPYQRQSHVEDPASLVILCRRWINQLPPVKPRRTP